jgi:uncharacterized protein (TIGR03435 family)
MKRWIGPVLILFVSAFPLTGAQQQQFEVASVKPTKELAGVRQGCHGTDSRIGANDSRSGVPLGRCVVSSGRLSHMIGMAYGVSMDMLKGGPEWVATGNDRYDIEARVEDPTSATEAQLIAMFQALLAERFKLKFHREPHDMPGFALVLGKNAPKLKEASAGDEKIFDIRAGGSGAVEAVKKAAGEAGARNLDNPEGPLVIATGQRMTIAELADALTPFAHGHILDETNLKGFYNFKLEFESGQSLAGPIQDQLGLRLESRKVPVDFIVVDYAEKPVTQQ